MMGWLRKAPDIVASARSIGPLRQARYVALVVAIAGLVWSGVAFSDTQRRDEAARLQIAQTGRTVADLRLQVVRQRAAIDAIPKAAASEEATAESLIDGVGVEARRSGLRMAQSRVIATPPSAQAAPAPAAPQGGQQGGQQVAAPAPPPDPGGVEFHLIGTYPQLSRMLKAIGESHARFQVLTLDVLRAKDAKDASSAQLDIRLVCIL
ncbi:MAG TPA: hypothetical protein VKT77_10915 [Chthonomonadaceae bacterium]|nr:hypothetical protein [Chthonomonadaceae bacterium]